MYYVDWGNTKKNVPIDDIRRFGENLISNYHYHEIPDLAIECSLAKVQPLSKEGKWSKKAIEFMHNLKPNYVAKIYSVVNDVVTVKLPISQQTESKQWVHKELIRMNLAEKAEESFLSKVSCRRKGFVRF